MSETTAVLRRKITGAGDLQSVVRTMKALAVSSVGQYEKSVKALADYYHTVELGLSIFFRENGLIFRGVAQKNEAVTGDTGVVVFGSDQGLVGQFNDLVADVAMTSLVNLPSKTKIWAVGEQVYTRLSYAGLMPTGVFAVPNSAKAITGLIGKILIESDVAELHLFYNRPMSGATYAPVTQQLLPLNDEWQRKLGKISWPTKIPPEVIGFGTTTLRALIREYLFVSLFRACAESLASENVSRLAAMGNGITRMMAP